MKYTSKYDEQAFEKVRLGHQMEILRLLVEKLEADAIMNGGEQVMTKQDLLKSFFNLKRQYEELKRL